MMNLNLGDFVSLSHKVVVEVKMLSTTKPGHSCQDSLEPGMSEELQREPFKAR